MATPAEQSAQNRLVIEESVQVPAPAYDVYRRWADFQRYPDFMRGIETVEPLGGNRYHWTGKLYGNQREWDTEITDELPNQRISWKSTSEPSYTATVSLYSPSAHNTEVRARMEYDVQTGRGGPNPHQMESSLRKDLRESLDMMRRLFTSEPSRDIGLTDVGQNPQGVWLSMAGPVIAGALGGAVGWWLERNNTSRRIGRKVTLPRTRVEMPAAIASWIFTGAGAASIVVSAGLRLRSDGTNALFVGQWAPTLLEAGVLARAVGHRGVRTPENTAGVSWGFAGATLGSVIASAVLHARGDRQDGLFVGQWAPSLLSASLMARFFDR